MKAYLEAEKQDNLRRRRERLIIASLLVIVSTLTTYLGIQAFDLGLDLPLSNTLFIFALININVILLLLLLFLTMRNLVKLLFERKKKIMGARLRTKLALAFMTLSLLPTIILFFVSVQFISTSIEFWYNLPIERSLKSSLEVGQEYYKRITDEVHSFGNNLSRLITYHGYILIVKKDNLEKFINEKRMEYHLASIRVFSKRMELRAISQDERIDLSPFKNPEPEVLRKSLVKGTDNQDIQSSPHGDLVSGIVPIFSRTESKAVVGLISLSKFIPGAFQNRLSAIARGFEEYNQRKMMKTPVKVSHLITLSIVTLLIVFSSVWFGFYLSKGITVPIQELADGTMRVASGDYDFFIDLESKDEMGVLVNSFNRMTSDLKTSKKKLEEIYDQLLKSNVELEQRRLYMEIVLANVAAGVISVGADGTILTINKSAEKMLDIRAEEIIRKNYKDVVKPDHLKVINAFLDNKSPFRKDFVQQQTSLSVDNKFLTLLISINVLRDDRGSYLGLVAVFEDLSEIERAQRLAAWREVAKRIAHEVKNPLTPIQLSAQRLKKKYGDKVADGDDKVFEECTNLIISQVDELKRLVNEFSSFARLPASKFSPTDLSQVIKDAISLYKETQKNVNIRFTGPDDLPRFKIDREQVKRVMINLLDNGIAAIEDVGEINIDLSYDQKEEMLRIEIADTGKGIPPDHKLRLFEPYFSTKKQGTGLGLTIVNTIISDHKGLIRVQDNEPRGTKFTIELPARV